MKKILAILCAAAMIVTAFAGCGSSSSSKADESKAESAAETKAEDAAADDAAADEEEADPGFTEYPIFEDQEVGFMNVSAVFFQAVPMSAGATIKEQKAEDYDIHLEADIAALENKLGYEKGSWVPYLTVDYKIEGDNLSAPVEGTFMEMAASDGPHYGANIKLPDAGTYNLTITIHSPADNDYLIHTDALTGPGGTFEDYFPNGEPLSYTYEGWNYTGPVTV